MAMEATNASGSRLDKLKALAEVLAKAIDSCAEEKSLAQLSRQYRETIREIEEIEGSTENNDEIAEILSDRESAGKSGAVR